MSNNIKKLPPIKKPKYTVLQFIEEARKVHGDRYDYDLLNHPTLSDKIKVVCRTHGTFEVRGQHHLNGSNCKSCVNEARSGTNNLAFQRALINFNAPSHLPDARLLLSSKVEFTCPKHGVVQDSRWWFEKNQCCRLCSTEEKERIATESLDDWHLYHYVTWKFTKQAWQTKRGFIDHYGKGRSKFGFHLDHQYSVKQGFRDHIPPYIIGHWSNLWLLPWKENISKNAECSVSKELLFSNYFNLKRKFG